MEFFISGPNALALIQKVTSNDASTFDRGQSAIFLPNDQGGIDLLIYKLKKKHIY
jgi:aminomethyltransferase